MLYQYTTKGNSDSVSKHADKTYYIIGGMMMLGGVISLIDNFLDIEPTKMGKWIVNVITTLGGLAFIRYQYTSNQSPYTSSIYSIFMDKDTIKILTEYGAKCEELPYSDISKVEFQSNNIYLHSQSNTPMDINLSLIHPEGKREELKTALDGIMVKYQISD